MSPHGGWRQNPGIEGYDPIRVLTGQGALAFALRNHCDVKVERERHLFAHDFLARAAATDGKQMKRPARTIGRRWTAMVLLES